jgi:hypothetical protein
LSINKLNGPPTKPALKSKFGHIHRSAAICSGCHRPAPGYDNLPERRFEFIPFWGLLVFFLYSMRRVQCRSCGVVVEEVPWSDVDAGLKEQQFRRF